LQKIEGWGKDSHFLNHQKKNILYDRDQINEYIEKVCPLETF